MFPKRKQKLKNRYDEMVVALIDAYNFGLPSLFEEYAAPQVLRKIAQDIQADERPNFGLDKYRSFKYVEKEGYLICQLRHDHVRVSGVHIRVGDDMDVVFSLEKVVTNINFKRAERC